MGLTSKGTCPDCGGSTDLCSTGPTFDHGCYFVCSENYDQCEYSGPIYESWEEASRSEEARKVTDK